MTGRKIVAAMAVVVGLATSVVDAGAAPTKTPEKAAADVRAREVFQKGDTAYAEGRYEEALASFQEAHELSGRPQLLFNISNALERLGKYAEAVDALEKYLASGKAKDRDVVQKRLANLRRRVEEQRKVDAAKDEEEKRRAAEEKQKSAEQPAPKQAEPTPTPTPPPPPKSTPILPILLLSGGGAALAASGVFGLMTLSARSDADAGCKDAPGGRLCTAEAGSAIDRDQTFGLVTDIALVSGLVLGSVGLYLLLTNTPDKPYVTVGSKPVPASKIRVEARPAGAGVVVVATF